MNLNKCISNSSNIFTHLKIIHYFLLTNLTLYVAVRRLYVEVRRLYIFMFIFLSLFLLHSLIIVFSRKSCFLFFPLKFSLLNSSLFPLFTVIGFLFLSPQQPPYTMIKTDHNNAIVSFDGLCFAMLEVLSETLGFRSVSVSM